MSFRNEKCGWVPYKLPRFGNENSKSVPLESKFNPPPNKPTLNQYTTFHTLVKRKNLTLCFTLIPNVNKVVDFCRTIYYFSLFLYKI